MVTITLQLKEPAMHSRTLAWLLLAQLFLTPVWFTHSWYSFSLGTSWFTVHVKNKENWSLTHYSRGCFSAECGCYNMIAKCPRPAIVSNPPKCFKQDEFPVFHTISQVTRNSSLLCQLSSVELFIPSCAWSSHGKGAHILPYSNMNLLWILSWIPHCLPWTCSWMNIELMLKITG